MKEGRRDMKRLRDDMKERIEGELGGYRDGGIWCCGVSGFSRRAVYEPASSPG